MRLQLERPLISVDTETTGTFNIDRIVQIAVVKLYPDGEVKEWQTYVNPGMPIPPEATEVHGITDQMVANAPPFKRIAATIYNGFNECDITGYNVAFDLRMIKREFSRLGLPTPLWGEVVDAFNLFRRKQPRRLEDAVSFYIPQWTFKAHDALEDARASLAVLGAQLDLYPDLPDRVDLLAEATKLPPNPQYIDAEGKFIWRYGEAYINFGPQIGVSLRKCPRGFLQWILRKDFSDEVKRIAREALAGTYPVKEEE